MKNLIKKLGLISSILVCHFIVLAQRQDSLKADLLISPEISDTLVVKQEPYIEIYKLNLKRTFKLTKNQEVRVYSIKTKTGRRKLKSAIISEINDHEITFKPKSKLFDEITYVDSSLTYIEIVTAGSVISGIVVNALLVSTVVVTVGIILIGSLVAAFYGASYYGGSGTGLGNFIGILPWSNFHKHIKFTNHRGIQKWGARVVGS